MGGFHRQCCCEPCGALDCQPGGPTQRPCQTAYTPRTYAVTFSDWVINPCYVEFVWEQFHYAYPSLNSISYYEQDLLGASPSGCMFWPFYNYTEPEQSPWRGVIELSDLEWHQGFPNCDRPTPLTEISNSTSRIRLTYVSSSISRLDITSTGTFLFYAEMDFATGNCFPPDPPGTWELNNEFTNPADGIITGGKCTIQPFCQGRPPGTDPPPWPDGLPPPTL